MDERIEAERSLRRMVTHSGGSLDSAVDGVYVQETNENKQYIFMFDFS